MIFANSIIPPMLNLGSADPKVRLEAVQQITRQLSVPGFLKTLRQHRLTPLIYHTLTQFNRKEVGEIPLLEELRRDYLASLRMYLNQESETHHLVEVLADAEVEVILLKGGDIRHRLYDDPACRPMNDVDVLISPTDLEKVRAILKREGYILSPRDLECIPNFSTRFSWEELYTSPRKDEVLFDLHWEIRKMGAFYRLPYASLQAKATPWGKRGSPLLILAPEHLLMNLCLNTLEELEEAGIQKFVDLDRALRRLPLDWDLFLQDAATFHIQGAVFWIFREMVKLNPQAVPGLVWERLAAYTPGWCERLILRRKAGSLVWASLANLWCHLPVREWPAFLKGKFWPDDAFIKANAQTFGSRIGYIQHLLKRTQDKT
jgi:hypothetical protein